MKRMIRSAPGGSHPLVSDRSAAAPNRDTAQIVSADENSVGTIDFDDLGQPRWRWITEQRAGAAAEDTFNYLKALENSDLALAEPAAESGYDPYDTCPVRPSRKRGSAD